jgi:hypothetical protein
MKANTTQHNTTQHNTTQHNTTQHNTTQHNTTQHNTTQHIKQKTHNNQHEPPPPFPPAALSSLSMGRSAALTITLAAASSYGPMMGTSSWVFAARQSVSLFGSTKRDLSTNREFGGQLALGGHRSLIQTQQPTNSRR